MTNERLSDNFPNPFGDERLPLQLATLDELDSLLGTTGEPNREKAASNGHPKLTLECLSSVDVAWPKLPVEARYGLAGEIVAVIEPQTEADPAALLTQILTAFGNVVGPEPHCEADGARHGMNLTTVLVGESSKARKGTSWNRIRKLFAEIDPQWEKERVTSGLSSAEGLIAEVADVDGDSTETCDRRLLVVEEEFASVLKVMKREGNTLSPTLRNAWDHGNMRTLVKTNPLKATGAHISAVGHITRTELLRHLNETESANGFANRILFACVRRSKCLPEGGKVPEVALRPLVHRLMAAVVWCKGEKPFFVRDADARDLWIEVYPALSQGVPGLLGAVTSRGEALVLRLSMIFAALDTTVTVRVEHLRAALALWDYCHASAKYIFGDATGDPLVDRINAALKQAGGDGMTRTKIRDLLGKHEKATRIEQALKLLADAGMARRGSVPAGDGRPTELWFSTEAVQ
jgi:hypothetical protein